MVFISMCSFRIFVLWLGGGQKGGQLVVLRFAQFVRREKMSSLVDIPAVCPRSIVISLSSYAEIKGKPAARSCA